MYEVWVRSSRMEGIHLRGAAVARGGIRHSDRPDDFRTEVMGLVLTQVVKNAVIVPSGSKGGFVCLRSLPEREAMAHEAREQYCTLMRGLLDITDNLDGEDSPPDGVIRYDDFDPYLVVAADKGTAPFSDTANAVAAEYDFWLDDAFASGGSYGYDHKEVGITAKGAWESVKRHFQEMGRNIQKDALHGGGDRRHERRRLRQRDAAVAPYPPRGRLRPPARLHRPRPGPRGLLRRTRAPLPPRPFHVGRLRPGQAVGRAG